jgi:protein gp37
MLTKRTANARRYLDSRGGCPSNMWHGATMENQPNFDRRIVDLLSVDGAAVYFASMEPLLGPVDVTPGVIDPVPLHVAPHQGCGCVGCRPSNAAVPATVITGRRLGWVIAGGESCHDDKTKSTPTHPDDALKVSTTCWAHDVPFYWKQWGDWVPAYELTENPQAQAMCLVGNVPRRDLGRGDGGRSVTYNVGKHAAGHIFEGEVRRDMPPIRLLG